jgi:hypothetical protein
MPIAHAAWLNQKINVEPAVGIGASSLNMSIKTNGEDLRYTPSNTDFYFINLGIENLSLQAKFPIRDSQEKLTSHGDTKVTDYQLGFGFQKNWQTDVYYQKYQGYYIESQTSHVIQPDLSFSHVGGQLTYVFDPEYSLAMTRETGWRQTTTKGSWMASIGYDEFDLDGDLAPGILKTGLRTGLQKTKADSLSLRISRGHNWIWDQWFAGMVVGLGANYSQIQYQYSTMQDSSSDMKLIANAGLSAGYRWKQAKVGIFARSSNWSLAFDDKELVSNTSSSGIYYSSYF